MKSTGWGIPARRFFGKEEKRPLDALFEKIADWLRGMLIDGIMGNLSGMFDAVNQQVANVSVQVGTTPENFSPGIL